MKYAIFIMTIVLLTSCEKVIDFDLKESQPQVVIESIANNESHTVWTKLSLSGDYYNPNEFDKITGATVSATINGTVELNLEEKSAGYYETVFDEVNAGDIFSLSVKIDGIEYSAVSELQEKVQVDSVFFQYSGETVFAPEGFRAVAIFTDPPGKGNYYRIQLYVNDEPATDGIIYLYNDNTTDGAPVSYLLYRNALQQGDRVRVELWTVDKQVYDYYAGLEKLISTYPAHMQVSPANPETNLTGGALGYFAAIAVTSSKIYFIE